VRGDERLAVRHDIWIVRHGETEWSRSRKHTSVTDVDLTERGERDAIALGPVLRAHHFALVLASPRRRARRTAELAGFAGALVEPDLAEWHYGEYEGRTTPEIRVHAPGWTVWHGAIPGGETIEDVELRVRRVIARCDQVGGDVLCFGHGHSLRVLTAVALGFGGRAGARFALDAGATGIIGFEHEYRTLRRWNATP
jgi:probable phosphoglycerate mutase